MAVSKSRKKSNKRTASRSGNPAVREAAERAAAAVPPQRHEPSVGGLFGGFSERRRQLDAQRARRAGREVAPVVEELLGRTASLSETEDDLCLRMGVLLSRQHPLDR